MKKNKQYFEKIPKRIYSGLTLVEVVIAVVVNSIVIAGVGALLIGGNRAWEKCYYSANNEVKQESLVTTLEFGSMGRKSNRLCYTIYKQDGSKFYKALPKTSNAEEIVSGDAVEFCYWDEELDAADSKNLIDSTKQATAYAFFYRDGRKLKVDYGPCPPGAVPDGSGLRNTTGVVTKILAKNIVINEDSSEGIFSHSTVNGVGQGSVRINVTLTDEIGNEKVEIMTSTFLRNIWPR